jgi:hypothetical protein
MRHSADNPRSNDVGSGVTEAALRAAVDRCEYPMQASVVRTISNAAEQHWEDRAHTIVQEEWTYQDRDTGDVRAIDALAESHLWPLQSGRQPRIRPVLSLLIECKQSELPHVFFTRPSERSLSPVLSGFPHSDVTLVTDDDNSTYNFPLTSLWGLDEHPFVSSPPVAVSLSKVRRNRSDLEITGEDTYNGLTLPLLKATEHLDAVTAYTSTHYTDGRLLIPLAVIRGPMVSVLDDGRGDLELIPWARVTRYEPESQPKHWRTHRKFTYDVVHEDYLATYMGKLIDYTSAFASAILDHQSVLLTGRGFAAGLADWQRPVRVDVAPWPQKTEPRRRARAILSPVFTRFRWKD